jgi:hypothetical protein
MLERDGELNALKEEKARQTRQMWENFLNN